MSLTIALLARRCDVIRSSLRTCAPRTAPDSSVIRKFMPRNGRGAYFDSSRSGAWPWSCIAKARSYRPSSSVTIMPPSPQVIVLNSLKLNVPAAPNPPTPRPL